MSTKELIPGYIYLINQYAHFGCGGDWIEACGLAAMVQRIDRNHPVCKKVFNTLMDKDDGDKFREVQHEFEIDINFVGLKLVKQIENFEFMGHPQAGYLLSELDRLCAASFWLDVAESVHPIIDRLLIDVRSKPNKWCSTVATATRILCEAPPLIGDPSRALWMAVRSVRSTLDRIEELKSRIKKAVENVDKENSEESTAILLGDICLLSKSSWGHAFENVVIELIDFASSYGWNLNNIKVKELRDEIVHSLKVVLMPDISEEEMAKAVAGAKRILQQNEENKTLINIANMLNAQGEHNE